MSWTAPATAVTGGTLSAAFWNTNVRDNLTALSDTLLTNNVLYTTGGTFVKADYPGLRAIRVRVQGAGGGGGGVALTGAGVAVGGGGGGGGYAEGLILASDLAATEAVTVGAGGAGGIGNNTGGTGGTSTFDTISGAVQATGGTGGGGSADVAPSGVVASGGVGGFGSGGDLALFGDTGNTAHANQADRVEPGGGGGSFLGASHNQGISGASVVGAGGKIYGGGGSGAANIAGAGSAKNGGAGAAGIVIVSLIF